MDVLDVDDVVAAEEDEAFKRRASNFAPAKLVDTAIDPHGSKGLELKERRSVAGDWKWRTGEGLVELLKEYLAVWN